MDNKTSNFPIRVIILTALPIGLLIYSFTCTNKSGEEIFLTSMGNLYLMYALGATIVNILFPLDDANKAITANLLSAGILGAIIVLYTLYAAVSAPQDSGVGGWAFIGGFMIAAATIIPSLIINSIISAIFNKIRNNKKNN